MYQLMDKVDNGVVPMLQDLQSYIKESGTADMHACAKVIVSVSDICRYILVYIAIGVQ